MAMELKKPVEDMELKNARVSFVFQLFLLLTDICIKGSLLVRGRDQVIADQQPFLV